MEDGLTSHGITGLVGGAIDVALPPLEPLEPLVVGGVDDVSGGWRAPSGEVLEGWGGWGR